MRIGKSRRPRSWLVLTGLLGLALAGSAVPTVTHAAMSENPPAAAASGPRAGYVAKGDSYSSGQGSFVYFPETDTATNQCHRSPLAYGPVLSYRDRDLRRLSFVACSGAVTGDLYAQNHAYPGEPAQLSALRRSTRTVSLTIGGNDLGFAEVAGACVQSPLQPAGFGCSRSPALNGLVAARLAALAGTGQAPAPDGTPIVAVAKVLRDIDQRAPRAEIFLAGYPELFGDDRRDFADDPTAPSQDSCVVNALAGARVDYADAQWFNATTRSLNRILRRAVRQARAAGASVTYVSASTFARHGLCDRRTAWIQPVLIDSAGQVLPESLHPTVRGQISGYARAFRRAGI
jgi:hypothetical protein